MKALRVLCFLIIALVSSCFFVGEGFAACDGPWESVCPDSESVDSSSSAKSPSSSVSSPLASPGFTFDPNSISPSSKRYTLGSSESSGNGNTITILKRIINILLVVVSTGAVLFTIVGGFFMATSAGDAEKANRGKTIITYNIIAVAIAMLSYGIMQFVIWLIGVPS